MHVSRERLAGHQESEVHFFYANKQMNKCILRDLEYNSDTQTVTKLLTYVERHTDSQHSSILIHPVLPSVIYSSCYGFVCLYICIGRHMGFRTPVSRTLKMDTDVRHKYLICCLAQWVSLYNCKEKQYCMFSVCVGSNTYI